MAQISNAAATRHGKTQVGAVHQMTGGTTGYGYLTWDARRGVWMQPYTTTGYQQAIRSRANWIKVHARAAQISGTTDTQAPEYRAALEAAQMELA